MCHKQSNHVLIFPQHSYLAAIFSDDGHLWWVFWSIPKKKAKKKTEPF